MDPDFMEDVIQNIFTSTTLGGDVIFCDLFSEVAEEIVIDGQSKDEPTKDEQCANPVILETFQFDNNNVISEPMCDTSNVTVHLSPLVNVTDDHVQEEIIVEDTEDDILVQVQYVDGNFLETEHIVNKEVTENLLYVSEPLPPLEKIMATDQQEEHVTRDKEITSYQRSFEKHVNKFYPKDGKSFKCRQCNLQFPILSALSNHCKTIHNHITKRHGCEFCSKYFIWQCDLKRHLKLCPQNSKTKQQEIQPQQETRKTNWNKKYLKKPYICSYCTKSFAYRSQWQIHLKKHTGEPSKQQFNCVYCNKSFRYSSQLDIHLRKHTGQPPKKEFVCNFCFKSFAYNSHLKLHLGVHTGEYTKKQFNCNFCSKSFDYKSHLEIHLRRHTGEDPKKEFKCEYCTMAFGYNSQLLLHIKKHTGEGHKKQYNCNICNKTFGYRSHLDNHQRIHTNERPYSCASCDKCFKSKSDLLSHQRAHTDDRPFVCFLCETGYKTQQNLDYHLKICNSRNEYNCKDCDATFSKRNDLVTHRKTHTQIPKKHVCEFCLKSFDHMFKLKLHVGIHTGERPFLCTICDLAFKSQHTFRKHQKIHSKSYKVETYLCEICSKTYASMGSLRRHKRRRHSEHQPKAYDKKSSMSDETSLNKLNESKIDLLEKSNDCNDDLLNESNDCINDLLKELNDESNKDKDLQSHKHVCEKCSKIFNTRANLVRHYIVHSTVRAYSCTVCEKSFKWPSYLKKHQKTHLNVYTEKHRYKCSFCEKAFVERRNWRNHERRHVDPQWKRIIRKKLHTCELCSMKFADFDHYQRHLKAHTAERPYSCGICQKAYMKNTHLNRHLDITHTKEEVYAFKQELAKIRHKCEICNKKFSCIFHLKRHLSVHTKERGSNLNKKFANIKKHICKICAKSCLSINNLKKHLKMHSKEQRFPCALCDKAYTKKDNLSRHISKNHSKKEKTLKNVRYCCKFCNKNFKQEYLLKYHQRKHLELKWNSGQQVVLKKTAICKICSKSFKRFNKLTFHLRRLHQTERNRVRKSKQCDVCKKFFKSHLSHGIHVRSFHRNSEIKKDTDKQNNIAKAYENMVIALVTCKENPIDLNFETKVNDIDPINVQQNNNSNVKDCKENPIDLNFETEVNDIESKNAKQGDISNIDECMIAAPVDFKDKLIDLAPINDPIDPNNVKQNDISTVGENIVSTLVNCKENLIALTSITEVNDLDPKCDKQNDISNVNNSITPVNDVENVKQNDMVSTLVDCKENLIELTPITAINDVDPLKVECNENANLSYNNNETKDKSVATVENFNDAKHMEDNSEEVICKEKINADQSIHVKSKEKKNKLLNVKRTFPCDLCEKVYAIKSSLYRHLANNHTQKEVNDISNRIKHPFSCDLCKKAYTHKSHLNRHLAHNHTKKEVNALEKEMFNRCRYCNKRFACVAHYKIHLKLHIKERLFSCTQCKKAYFQNAHLNRHLKKFHNAKSLFSCDLCKKTYLTKTPLKRHLTINHTREKVNDAKKEVSNEGHICKYCNKSFNCISHYKRHLKLHSDITNFPKDRNHTRERVSTRLKSFERLNNLTMHLRRVHQIQPNRVKIPLHVYDNKNKSLYSKLKSKTSLNILKDSVNMVVKENVLAINNNRKEQSYVDSDYHCSICKIIFKDKRSLNTHQRIHVKSPTKNARGERKYICEICSMKFAKFINYKKHVKLHSSERPFPCALCDKAYLRKSHLKRHIDNSHLKVEVYSLNQASSEKQHIKVNYNKSFSGISQLERPPMIYIKKKHLYSCDLCKKNFKHEFLLKYHHKSKHLQHKLNGNKKDLPKKNKICKICSKSFDRLYKLTSHLRRLHQTQRNRLNYRAILYDSTPVNIVNNFENINDSDNAEDVFKVENSDNLNVPFSAQNDYILDHLNSTTLIDIFKTDNIEQDNIIDTPSDLFAVDVINNMDNRIEETYTYQYLTTNDERKDHTVTNEEVLKDSEYINDIVQEIAILENTDEIKEELHTELEIKDELLDDGMNSTNITPRKNCVNENPTPQEPEIRIQNVYPNYEKDKEKNSLTSPKQGHVNENPAPQEPEIRIQNVYFNYESDKDKFFASPKQDYIKENALPQLPKIRIQKVFHNYEKYKYFSFSKQDHVKENPTPQEPKIRIQNIYFNYESDKEKSFALPKQDYIKENALPQEPKNHIQNVNHDYENDKGKSFASSDNIEWRPTLDTDPQPYYCSLCKLNFKSKFLLMHHQKKHSQGETIGCNNKNVSKQKRICRYCLKFFDGINNLNGHIRRVHQKKPNDVKKPPLPNNNCNVRDKPQLTLKSFDENDNLNNEFQMEISNDKMSVKDNSNHSDINDSQQILNVEDTINISKTNVCKVCSKSFANSYNLIRHLRIHTGERLYSCAMCKKSYMEKRDMIKHEKKHFENCEEDLIELTPVSAVNDLDPLTVKSKENQKLTDNDKTKDPSVTFSKILKNVKNSGDCPDEIPILENAIINNTDKVTNTKLKPKKENQSICRICSKVFDNKLSLRGHLRIHSSERPVVCSLCGKGFKDRSTCSNHKKWCLKQKRYSNSKCLQNSENINITENAEREKKIYTCTICSKNFSKEIYLKNHLKSHSEKRPYVCYLCGKDFRHKFDYDNHQKLHSLDRYMRSLEHKLKVVNETKGATVCEENHSTTPINIVNYQDDVEHLKYFENLEDISSYAAEEIIYSEYTDYTIEDINSFSYIINSIGMDKSKTENTAKRFEDDFTESDFQRTNEDDDIAEPSLYQCSLCTEVFNSQQDLKIHVKKFKSQLCDTYCKFCSKSFLRKDIFEKHLKQHTDGHSYHCKLCEITFKDAQDLNNHQEIHLKNSSCCQHQKDHDVNTMLFDFKCGVCDQINISQRNLIKHVQQFHCNENAFKCLDCSDKFSTITALLNHSKMHKPLSKKEACKLCLQNIDDDHSYYSKTFKDINIYTCEFCGKSFKLSWKLNKHLKTHTMECPYSCTQCEKSYKIMSELVQHRNTKHSNFKSKIKKTRKIACKLCSKLFYNIYYLKRHLRTHSGERPFSCSLCGNAYKDKVYLKEHQMMHLKVQTGELPYYCAICIRAFKDESSWTKHQEYHNVKCSVCKKVFKNNRTLKKHQRLHLKEQKRETLYCCIICGKNYRNYRYWIRHQKMHSESKESNVLENKTVTTDEKLLYAVEYPKDFDHQEDHGHNQMSTNDHNIKCDLMMMNQTTKYFDKEIKFSEKQVKDNNLVPIIAGNDATEINFSNINSSPCSSMAYSGENSPKINDNVLPTNISTADVRNIKCVIQISKNYVSNNEATIKNLEDNWSESQQKSIFQDHNYMTNKCAVCKEVFDCHLDLLEHVQNIHPNFKGFKCRECGVVISNFESFLQHTSVHKEPTP